METLIYRIDKKDLIIYVSDNWIKFAQENGAAEACHPTAIINKPLWDFIADIETSHLYETILKKVRAKKKSITIPYRCDSPDMRRFLKLELAPISKGFIEFRSQIIRSEQREPVRLLENDIERSEEFLTICSMCKKIATPERGWLEVEDAIVSMRLFEKSKLPQLTHGLCPGCLAVVQEQIDKLK